MKQGWWRWWKVRGGNGGRDCIWGGRGGASGMGSSGAGNQKRNMKQKKRGGGI